MATRTASFGVGRREAHDASPFYARFAAPEISDDDTVAAPRRLADPFFQRDARLIDDEIDDNSVALVVTSPPYFTGKQYEQELGARGVPASYAEYLDLLHAVFARCKDKLEPGGRIAVNVANLGRKPYRSLAADVIGILEDLGLLLRGEIVWQKGEGASGSCAWGSFRSPVNPVLRDLTERVVIACKGRFDRAKSVPQRVELGLPHRPTISSDEYMEATLDVWALPAERATRVGHPAPFPVELPQRLIELYTFEGDLVLDPFMGAGSALVAAARTGRRYAGYDTDPAYVAIARRRVADELERRLGGDDRRAPSPDAVHAEAVATGQARTAIAAQVLEAAGFSIAGKAAKVRGTGVTVGYLADDVAGHRWYVDVTGGFTTSRAGLQRADTAWRSLGQATALAQQGHRPVLLLTSHLPAARSDADRALRAAGPEIVFDAIAMLSDDGRQRLAAYATGGHHRAPLPGFWSAADIARGPRSRL